VVVDVFLVGQPEFPEGGRAHGGHVGRRRVGVRHLIVTGRLVLGTVRRAQPRDDLLGPTSVLAILGFVAGILAVSLPTSFALKAAGVRYPATAGILLAGVFMVVGHC
jgi:hypothetical protein